MIQYLITGFEPFTTGQGLKLTHNPTGKTAQRIADRLENAYAATLPVAYRETRPALEELFESHRPLIWLGLGYAPHRLKIDVETVALNLEHATSSDNAGESPNMRPIIAEAPLAYRSRINEAAAVDILKGYNLDAQIATHAGTFLCNQSFFVGCHVAENSDFLKVGSFIHVPPLESFEVLEEALAEVLRKEAQTVVMAR